MRQTDVQVRDAELLREQKEKAESASSSSTPPEHPKQDDVEDKRTQRRKEKKEKKKAEKFATLTEQDLHPVDSDGRPLEYDQTLLAVIGVLDAIREEDNVAGWTRSGGLVSSTRHVGASPSEGPQKKKRRLSGESVVSSPPSSSSPPQSPIEGADGESVPAESAQAVPLASNLWFEHEESFRNWAQRGLSALQELGIEANPGITGSSG
jgi:hypothetical protein